MSNPGRHCRMLMGFLLLLVGCAAPDRDEQRQQRTDPQDAAAARLAPDAEDQPTPASSAPDERATTSAVSERAPSPGPGRAAPPPGFF